MVSVKAHLIMELMGRPPEHITEALKTLVTRMNSENGVEILNTQYHDPKEVEKGKNLYTVFAEIDATFDSIDHLFNIVMGYMPSNVEIYEPERFKLEAHNLNTLASSLVSKLHRYDDIAKRAIFERDILLKQVELLKAGSSIEETLKKKSAKKPAAKKKPTKKKTTKKKK